jgi:CRISPR-associated protein Csx3
LGLIELRNGSPLVVQVLPSGALFALRHASLLINQLLPGPAEDGLFRLLLRWRAVENRDAETAREERSSGWASLVGAGLGFAASESGGVEWNVEPRTGLVYRTQLELHPTLPAWAWCVQVLNRTAETLSIEVLHAQDLGLADEAAVRNNEAYTSQYIDLLPLQDEELGWTILARQNQPAGEGRHPWLVTGCVQGAEAFCTDGWQFFGADHRLTGEPAAVREPRLPSKRLQYESALAGLQSRAVELAPGAETEIVFVARFVADHPGASGAEDLALVREAMAGLKGNEGGESVGASEEGEGRRERRPYTEAEAFSLFTVAAWVHGEEPAESDLREWFPGPHRQVEMESGQTLAFFCDDATHVVTRAKEALVLRPHGHVLRSGDSSWIDEAQFGVTAYAAGIFSAQSYLGNPNLARLLPVVRNALGVARAAGQRVFVRVGAEWRQLGVPSAFAMTPGEVRWIYRLGADQIEARVWCSARLPAALLELRVVRGEPREFLITHQLALGANEFDHGGTLQLHHDEGWAECTPRAESFTAKHLPGTCFAIAADQAASVAAMGGDELIYSNGVRRSGPYLVVQTRAVSRCGIIQVGSTTGPAALGELVASARAEFASSVNAAAPTALPLRLRHADPGVGRIAEVLPWFNHNAAIHFSAPHGLEQYGGAAWGVRDVCQGSIEWLLASGRYEIARRVLTTVFAQQYFGADAQGELTGTWPQWFMFPPFHFIQQAHSHGDVCFWPVKALCDYAEAANDVAFLGTPVGYTDPKTFTPVEPQEPLWAHCDCVIAHAESRFVAGTALVNYGDGDWDDTLQPADLAMRSRMISAWTVGLAYHTFRQLGVVARRAGKDARAARLEALLARMRTDFARHLMPDGTVAGFLVTETGELDGARPLLHPRDRVTGIRHRLLPMTRSVLAELFTPAQAERHREIIERELRYPDGVRLMSEPAVYHGGLEKLFKRADTAANVGREIGLQYVHAHLRYAEAMAKLGDAERLWWALQVVNPVGLTATVPHTAPRQSNTYFSSSDADFADRYEAAARWSELREGRVSVRGGWRLYSSGPGLFLHNVRACLLGVRESFDEIVFDPVLPRALDGLIADVSLRGRAVEMVYHVKTGTCSPSRIVINGAVLASPDREANPYRLGGLRVSRATLERLLTAPTNRIEVEL